MTKNDPIALRLAAEVGCDPRTAAKWVEDPTSGWRSTRIAFQMAVDRLGIDIEAVRLADTAGPTRTE